MSRVGTTVATFAAIALSITLVVGAVAQDEPEASSAPDETEAVGALDGTEPTAAPSIEDRNWLLAAQVMDGELAPLDEEVVVSLRMVNGQAGGTGGCNGYISGYELDGLDVTFEPPGHTQVGCAAPRGEAEQAFFANLPRAASYQSGGTQMAFMDEAGEPLLAFDLAPLSMVVGSWEANGISDGKRSLEGNQHTSRIKATFAEDGTLTGTDGCNDYSASYRIDDQVMRIRKIRIERRQCGRPHRKNARRYYAALRATRTWSITMFGFTLHDDRGVMQVTLGPNQAAPEPEPSS